MAGYEYDVFVSYNRRYPVDAWIANHFLPKLRGWLHAYGLLDPRIFIDLGLPTGTAWQREIENALKTSRCLVAICSPGYFYSRWCLTELHTMLSREKIVGLRSKKKRLGIIYPIRFSDGEHFPPEILKIQYRDMQKWNYPDPVFEKDENYLSFDAEMRKLCEELIEMIKNAPKWDSRWPVVYKKAKPIKNVPFPRFI